jgi:cytochrome c5
MERLIIKPKSFLPLALIIFVIVLISNSCYYDNEEYVYPNPTACDTTNVTYSLKVAPILAANCNACHSAVAPTAGIITDSYAGLQPVVANGKFRGAINHLPGFSPMPQGGNKLSPCDLAKIDAWLNAGAPNN